MIIFRGSIQYLINPKKYFSKAISLLNAGGLIFIKLKKVIIGDGKDIKSPAWFDNMISVVYMKIN